MGSLIEKKIIQSRVYRDPNAPAPPDFNYDYTYPITTLDAVIDNYDDPSPLNLRQIFKRRDAVIGEKQQKVMAGNPLDIMAYSGIEGEIAGLKRVVNIGTVRTNTSDLNIPTERAVYDALASKIDGKEFEEHAHNESIHIEEEERELWNNKVDNGVFAIHSEDHVIHITGAERKSWNGKADNIDFISHRDNINNPHKLTASQLNCYTKQEVLELFESAELGFFRDKSLSYDGILGVQVVPYDPSLWNPNFLLGFMHSLDELAPYIDNGHTFIALRAATNYLTNASDIVEVWIKRPNLIWSAGAPSSLTLKNGDMFIKYPDKGDSKDNELWVWLGGQFKQINTK